MDQVKAVLAVMKKNAFWILIGIVVLTGLGVWFTTSSALAKRYADRKEALTTAMTTVSGIKSEATGENATHPNEEKIAQWEKLVEDNRVEAWKAWIRMFQIQEANNKWPESLSKEFRAMIKAIGDADIPANYLIEYQNFIKLHFPVIDEIIDRRKLKKVEGQRGALTGMGDPYGGAGGYEGAMPGAEMGYEEESAMGGAYGPGSGTAMAGPEKEGIVDWVESDYARIQADVYWLTRPLTIEVRLAQEDLWVYEALLRAIAKTNKDANATSYYNAAIKKIWALEIGKPAASAMKSAKSRLGLGARPGGTSGDYMEEGSMPMSGDAYDSEGMMPEGDYEAGGMGMGMGMGMGPGAVSRDPEMVKKKLLTGRYVDLTGEPQAADSMPFAEFKLMPVHIIVTLDQQKLPDFLVNLANCEMPVDVKQVSIQANGKMVFSSGGTGGYGGGMAGMSGMGGGYGGGYGGEMGGYGGEMGGYGGEMGGYGGGMDSEGGYGEMGGYGGEMGGYGSGMGGAKTTEDEAKQDVPVEIFGVIRIFNPPDLEKLGTGTAKDGVGETPASAEPAPAAPTPAGGPGATPGPAAPAVAPGPSATPGPGAGPVPGAAPGPGVAPLPGAGPAPGATPGPGAAPAPGATPAPAPGPGPAPGPTAGPG